MPWGCKQTDDHLKSPVIGGQCLPSTDEVYFNLVLRMWTLCCELLPSSSSAPPSHALEDTFERLHSLDPDLELEFRLVARDGTVEYYVTVDSSQESTIKHTFRRVFPAATRIEREPLPQELPIEAPTASLECVGWGDRRLDWQTRLQPLECDDEPSNFPWLRSPTRSRTPTRSLSTRPSSPRRPTGVATPSTASTGWLLADRRRVRPFRDDLKGVSINRVGHYPQIGLNYIGFSIGTEPHHRRAGDRGVLRRWMGQVKQGSIRRLSRRIRDMTHPSFGWSRAHRTFRRTEREGLSYRYQPFVRPLKETVSRDFQYETVTFFSRVSPKVPAETQPPGPRGECRHPDEEAAPRAHR